MPIRVCHKPKNTENSLKNLEVIFLPHHGALYFIARGTPNLRKETIKLSFNSFFCDHYFTEVNISEVNISVITFIVL